MAGGNMTGGNMTAETVETTEMMIMETITEMTVKAEDPTSLSEQFFVLRF